LAALKKLGELGSLKECAKSNIKVRVCDILFSMKILALEQEIPGTRPEQFALLLNIEAAHIWELYLSGGLREIYFRQDRSEAVLILECADAEEARKLISSLPLVQAGLIHFEVIPLVPYPGFERLFSQQPT
jgi:Muconolactone delta-isomerase